MTDAFAKWTKEKMKATEMHHLLHATLVTTKPSFIRNSNLDSIIF